MKIIVADDHPIVADGIESLLATEGDVEVVARCVDGDEALTAIKEHRPDVAVLDLNMPGRTGIGVMAALKEAGDATDVVLLAAELPGDQALEAVRLGVRGIVLKAEAPRRLLDCLRAVASGNRWIEPSTFPGLLDAALERESAAAQYRDRLTERERDVVRCVAQGLSNRRIARELDIGEGTVKTHLYNIFQKLDVQNRTQLSILAARHGLG